MDHIPNKTIRDDRFSERLFELFISVDKNIFFAEVEIICNLVHHSACEFSRRWGYSSAGRALRSQCRGRGFDPHYLHQTTMSYTAKPRYIGASNCKSCQKPPQSAKNRR